MKQFFHAIFIIVRPINVLLGFCSAIIVACITKQPIDQNVLLAGLTICFFIGAGNALNDFFDWETDQTNRPGRPIPAGLMTRCAALKISLFFFASGLSAVSMTTNPVFPIVSAIVTVLILLEYNRKWKQLPLVGNIVVAFLLGFAFLFTGIVIGQLQLTIWPFILAFGLSLIREIIKDLEDYPGDLKAGFRTTPIVFGENTTMLIVVCFSVFFIICSLLPIYLGIYKFIYFWIVVFGVILPLIILIFSLLANGKKANFSALSLLLKWSTVVGLFAIYFGGH